MVKVVVRNVTIGEGRPKICAPIVGRTEAEIIEAAKGFCNLPVDVAEWRADWFEGADDMDRVRTVLKGLRQALGGLPLLFTFRSSAEGGERAIASDAYAQMLKDVSSSGLVDMIDVEAFFGRQDIDVATYGSRMVGGAMMMQDVIAAAHAHRVAVIASNHDFERTPDREELVARLRVMQAMHADVAKIAVMPRNFGDVTELLAATREMSSAYARCPIVTMSMSADGLVSRLLGEVFGSAMTFGSAGRASAPGQIDVSELAKFLDLVHQSLPTGQTDPK